MRLTGIVLNLDIYVFHSIIVYKYKISLHVIPFYTLYSLLDNIIKIFSLRNHFQDYNNYLKLEFSLCSVKE